MCATDRIIDEMSKIQRQYDLTKTELACEMAKAIATMLEMIEPSLKALSAHFEKDSK